MEFIGKPAINISVIIPAFNSEATIADTIRSVQSQTYDGWEVVVIDDGSTDGTTVVVKDLISKDCRIKLFTQPNLQVSAARNNGIVNAKFDWLLFLDSDDWVAPDYFEKVATVLNSDPSIDAVHCSWTRVTTEGKVVRKMSGPASADLFSELARHCPFAIHSCIIKKKVVETAGGFDTTLKTCEDWDFWQKIARIGARFKRLDEVMAFYRMRKNSLSGDGIQFFKDAIRVASQAYSPDERLASVKQHHFEGEDPRKLPGLKLTLAAWLAGLLIGSGNSTTELVMHLSDCTDPSISPFWVADNLFEGGIIPSGKDFSQWHVLYPTVEVELKKFLSALEAQSKATYLAERSLIILQKLILENTKVNNTCSFGHYYATSIDITKPVEDIFIENGAVERLFCVVTMDGAEIGKIQLPVFDQFVSAWVLKDAIAAKLAWQILEKVYSDTIYNSFNGTNSFPNQLHNEIGWLTFLQQIWNRPGWEMNKFYEAELDEQSSVITWDRADAIVIEVLQELPVIKIEAEELSIIYSVAGVKAGTITVPVTNTEVKPSQLRSAINFNAGFELCRVYVREQIIGTKSAGFARHTSIAESAQPNNLPTGITISKKTDRLTLGRRPGLPGMSVSRRAMLPAVLSNQLIEMAENSNEVLIESAEDQAKVDGIFYRPEVVTAGIEVKGFTAINSTVREANPYGRQHFETLFSKAPDPWKYTIPYEQTKYELTLSLIPNGKINQALEIACAEGHFTMQLAPYVNKLTAVDISQVALERTAERCKNFKHINYQHLDLVKDNLPGNFDLIVCSEVLYYVGGLTDLTAVSKKFANSLLTDGCLIMAHANQIVDEPDKPGFDWGLPFGAKVIGETFSKVASLQLEKEIRTPLYRIQLFRKVEQPFSPGIAKTETFIQYLDQPAPVPDAVKDSVRWNGGQPTDSSSKLSTVTTDKLPVLMYHRVSPDGAENMSRYRVTPSAFEEQLKYLKESGYYSVNLSDWLTAITLKRPLPGLAIALTFDDGYQDFYEHAWPLLLKYGFTATVFLVSDHIGKQNSWDAAFGEVLPLMGWKEILELQQQGVVFESHTTSHKPLTSLSPADIVLQGAKSRTDLQKALQKPVKQIAYPYGDTDEVVAHLMGACGYTTGFSCANKLSTFNDDMMLIPRIEVEGLFSLAEFVARLT